MGKPSSSPSRKGPGSDSPGKPDMLLQVLQVWESLMGVGGSESPGALGRGGVRGPVGR